MNSTIPDQKEGNEMNVEETLIAPSHEAAELLFNAAMTRLIHVNDWHTLTHHLLSRFQLTDSRGRELFREVREGDLIRIDIPAPRTKAGEGFDWVKVEDIDYRFEKEKQGVSIRVRPVCSPFHPEDGVAHFFGGDATSTFKVIKVNLKIMAGIYGRNEIPNVKSEKVIDNIRNIAVATGAILGASKIQWSSLVNGILNFKE